MTIHFPECTAPRGGHEFFAEIAHLPPGPERDEAIWLELEHGNIPEHLRTCTVLSLALPGADPANVISAQLDVTPDYLAIGTILDYVRVPMTPLLAQRVCDTWEAQLPTKHVVDAIWNAAPVKLAPQPWGPPYDSSMLSVERLVGHNDRIEQALGLWQRKNAPVTGRNMSAIVAGHKKDVVVTPELLYFPRHVAIYGWHDLHGHPIQSLNPRRGGATNTHEETYADYSHGIRLLARAMIVDGNRRTFNEVLADPGLSALVSDEGPSTVWRYG